MTARRWCGHHHYQFTTSFHTKFPEFILERMGIPLFLTYGMARWFHNRAAATLVPTPSLVADLQARGFTQCRQWTHGVDTERFHPSRREPLPYPGPVQLYVGRVSVEKNLEAFLSLSTPGTKLIVGDGPARAELQAKYPSAVFLGIREGEELARLYASADVFVFPSKTDTFGLVLLEALASGTPVAAFPVTGPVDVVGSAPVGGLSDDLAQAVRTALTCSRDLCRSFAEPFSWAQAERIFMDALVPLHPPATRREKPHLLRRFRRKPKFRSSDSPSA
jgi:hypothetical protein